MENPRKWLYGALRLEVFSYFKKKDDKHINIDEVFNDVGLTFINAMRDVRILLDASRLLHEDDLTHVKEIELDG